MQDKMFHLGHLIYLCLDPECFAFEHVWDLDEIVWKEQWSSEIEDLTPVPYCPHCDTVLWREVNDGKT